jgi:hypothetical protein
MSGNEIQQTISSRKRGLFVEERHKNKIKYRKCDADSLPTNKVCGRHLNVFAFFNSLRRPAPANSP